MPPGAVLWAPQDIVVHEPPAAAELEDIRDLQITWGSVGAPVLAVVVEARPEEPNDLVARAVWAASRKADQPQRLAWDDGFLVDEWGHWLTLPADYAPTGRLYVVLQALLGGDLVAISPPVPIMAAGKFPIAGDACGDDAACDHPLFPQACWDGFCRRLCSSGADCPGDPFGCEPPRAGVRFCAL